MFILLQTGAMLNLFWLQDCFQGKHEKNIVIFYMVNGSKITETYDTEAQAEARVKEIHNSMLNASFGGAKPIVVSELPKDNIIESATYFLKTDNGTEEDSYTEYKYVDGKWEIQGATQTEVQKVEQKFDEQLTWNEY